MQIRAEIQHPAIKTSAAAKYGRLEPLTGLRGVAACSVLVAHAIDTSFYYSGAAIFHAFAARLAYFGMALFFVLSGFVIQYNYAGSFASQPLGAATYRFFVARFARLYPLYIVSIICSLSYIPPPTFGPRVILTYLTLTQSWLNVQFATFAPDWSISAEWFFYVAFVPLTFAVAGLRRPILALAILCGPGAVALAASFYYWHQPLTEFSQHWFWHRAGISADPWAWFSYYSPYLRLLEFLAGVLVAKSYQVHESGGRAPVAAWFVMVVALAWCAAVIFDGAITSKAFLGYILPSFIFAPVLAPLMLCLCRYESSLSRLLASRPAVFLGEISYSIYIWSFFVMTMMTSFYVSAEKSALAYANSVVKMIVIVGLTIVFAYGSYALIEAPSRRWIREILGGGRLKATAA
jgi:peptidoglycan/LPS O-acetylase OafA/YrhL